MESKFFFIRVNRRHVRVDFDRLVYIEARGSYTLLHLEQGDLSLVSLKLKEWNAILPAGLFFRINKSAIVNLSKVVSFSNEAALVGNKEFTISRDAKPALLAHPAVFNEEKAASARADQAIAHIVEGVHYN